MAKKKKEMRPGEARRRGRMMSIRTETLLATLNVINTSAVLVLPCSIIHITNAEPVPSFVVVIFSITLWMKLVSFAHCNADLRSGPSPSLVDHFITCFSLGLSGFKQVSYPAWGLKF